MEKFVRISYTGRIKEGNIFDTTDKDLAKKEGIFDENRVYKPLSVVVGQGQVIEGLDEVLKDMKKGEKRAVEIPPEKGYGKKDPNLIKLVPLRAFKKEGVRPVPGMPVELDGRIARIQTVSGGRVRVDFNHELAGKTLVYNVKIEDIATKNEDRIRFLIERSFNDAEDFNIKINKKILEIEIPEKAYKDRNVLLRKASLSGDIFRFLNFESIMFVEVWEKEKSK
ncbi:MAG TPA: peptidylprolyl isomerase [Candidatus Altiarchaeales archaeon]|nr:peptidylprolyl isomerase [Candidatus Altiarchaeales archaeon]